MPALAVRLSEGGRRTVMHVSVTEQTLTGESEDPAHLQDGTAIPAADARRMAYTADLRRVLRDADGALLDLGRARRLASTDQREAILAQYTTCSRQGCDIPAYLCEIDHIQPWHPTGRTDLTNLAPLCTPDNKWKSRHPDRVDIITHANGTVTMRFHRHPKLHPHKQPRPGQPRQQHWQPRQPQPEQSGRPWQPGEQTPTTRTPTPAPPRGSHPTPAWPPSAPHPTPAPPRASHPTPAPPGVPHPTPGMAPATVASDSGIAR